MKVDIASRLLCYVSEWQTITNDEFVLSCISGYRIPFCREVLQDAVPIVHVSEGSAMKKYKMVIEKLLSKEAIGLCKPEEGQFLSSFSLVPKPDGSSRLI